MPTTSLRDRLQRGVSVLARLSRARRVTGIPLLGFDQECLIVARELRELEEDIRRDPGALRRFLSSARWRSTGAR